MLLLRSALLFYILSFTILNGTEPSKVLFYRAIVPSIPEPSAKFSLDASVQRGMVLSYLLLKDECVVEKVGEATIIDGNFSLDKTYDVHFFLEGKDGAFSLNTTEQKSGYLFSGTIKAEDAGYLIDIHYMFSYVTKRLPLGFAKNLAPDLAVGMPEMSTHTLETKANAFLGIPVLLAGGMHHDPKKMVLTYLILE